MTKFDSPVQSGPLRQKPARVDQAFIPPWVRCENRYAQNLLEASDDPIEYDHDDEDYRDNCFFFPEDCTWSPPNDWVIRENGSSENLSTVTDACFDNHKHDTMIPGLPDIKMLDSAALSGLLEDNLSPPEITSILVFATNGALFAYASPHSSRQLRNLSATYGAAYTSYAKSSSNGNLTGVNPASHPSSYATAQSVSLGDVGSIVFELDDTVSVVTRIADKVLLAAVGPSKLGQTNGTASTGNNTHDTSANPAQATDEAQAHTPTEPTANGSAASHDSASNETSAPSDHSDATMETQYQIDRSADLTRLASLNLSTAPAILLALESKSAALGRFLSQKLEDLESPEDF